MRLNHSSSAHIGCLCGQRACVLTLTGSVKPQSRPFPSERSGVLVLRAPIWIQNWRSLIREADAGGGGGPRDRQVHRLPSPPTTMVRVLEEASMPADWLEQPTKLISAIDTDSTALPHTPSRTAGIVLWSTLAGHDETLRSGPPPEKFWIDFIVVCNPGPVTSVMQSALT